MKIFVKFDDLRYFDFSLLDTNLNSEDSPGTLFRTGVVGGMTSIKNNCCRQVVILFLLHIHIHFSGLGKCMCPTLVHETHINKTNFIFHIIHLFDGVFDNVETTILVPRLQFSIPQQSLFFPFQVYYRDFYILIIVAVGFEVIVFRGFPPKKPNACQSVDDQLDVTDSHT